MAHDSCLNYVFISEINMIDMYHTDVSNLCCCFQLLCTVVLFKKLLPNETCELSV
jgi:hypothetical protein